MDEENVVSSSTVVTSQSYGSRIKESCQGACFGILLIFASIALLVWNEGNAVSTQKSLDEGNAVVLSLSSIGSVDSMYEGKLVHLTGAIQATNGSLAHDDLFGVSPVLNNNNNNNSSSAGDLKLERSVEMYQWVESSSTKTKKEYGGSETTTTTYSYTKEWRSTNPQSSNTFNKPTGHGNPTSIPYPSQTFVADPITLGVFTLSEDIVNRLNWFEPLGEPLSVSMIPDAALRNKTQVYNQNTFFVAQNFTTTQNQQPSLSTPTNPHVGDVRIHYRVVPSNTVVSLVAQQVGNTFVPYRTTAGNRDLLLLEQGTWSADAMFQQAEDDKKTQAWVLRFVGFIVMYVGFLLIAEPLSTFADVVPFLGNTVGTVAACIFFPIALLLSLAVIGLSWLAFRPGLALGIFAGVVAASVAFWYLVLKDRGLENNSHTGSSGPSKPQPDHDEEEEVVVAEEDIKVDEEEEQDIVVVEEDIKVEQDIAVDP